MKRYTAVFVCMIMLSLVVSRCAQPVAKTFGQQGFHAMLEHYWKDMLALKPMDATVFGDNSMNDQFPNTCTKAYRDSLKAFYVRYTDSLKSYDTTAMKEEDMLSYKILAFDCSMELERSTFDTWKIPFTQMGDPGNTLSANMVLAMGQFGSGESAQPFKTVTDYENWLKRIHSYVVWCDSAIGNFKQGMATQYVLPKALVVKIINVCNGLVSNNDTVSIFYGPVKMMPASFSAADKERLTAEYIAAIKNELNPAHIKMASFLKNEYLPAARTTSGVSALPNGMNYYAFCVKDWTTTNKTMEKIYNTGLDEVSRIKKLMEETKDATGFKGDLPAFFEFMKTDKQFMPFNTPAEVLDSFRHIYSIIKPALNKYFMLFPKSDFEIVQTEAFRAASASIEYLQGSPDGTRKGRFYVPVIDATMFNITSGMESTFLHEAVPGHHYQVSLQMEDTALPSFRRFKWYGAYGEGWALYSESLGSMLGLYTNPYQHMGALGDEMHRAIRLVVDVAIHSKGMTREEAIKYMMDNEAVSLESATAEIERYMAYPGQALSYKVGALKIMELRNRYSKELGAKFNIAAYHKEVLNSGCLPLVVMESKLDKWAAGMKK